MKITNNHYRMYMNVINKLPRELGILVEQFPVMLSKNGMCFPKRETTQLFAVIPPEIQQQLGLNYTVFCAATSPPHHFQGFGLDDPMLELKLSRITGPDEYFSKVWLSMFPSGRLLFEGFGIIVDSEGVLSSINEEYFGQCAAEEGLKSPFYQFALAMMLSVEIPDSKTRYVVRRSMELLEQQMRVAAQVQYS